MIDITMFYRLLDLQDKLDDTSTTHRDILIRSQRHQRISNVSILYPIVMITNPFRTIWCFMVRLLRKYLAHDARKQQHDSLEISNNSSPVRPHAVDVWAALQRREVVRVFVVCSCRE